MSQEGSNLLTIIYTPLSVRDSLTQPNSTYWIELTDPTDLRLTQKLWLLRTGAFNGFLSPKYNSKLVQNMFAAYFPTLKGGQAKMYS